MAAANETKQITMLTYNIWFDEFQMEKRMKGIAGIIEELKPNIISLNEVTLENLALLRIQAWFAKYKMVPQQTSGEDIYFVVILTDMPITSWRAFPFETSSMGRKLLIAELLVPQNNDGTLVSKFTIATSHLESLDYNTREREQQLKKSIDLLSPYHNVCFMGDMNLETQIDGEIFLPKPWYDAWLSLPDNSNENGYTWDPTVNKMLRYRTTRNRLDRVYCKLAAFRVHMMRIVGNEALSPGVFPSDHFGIFTTLTPATPEVESAEMETKVEGEVIFNRPVNWKKSLRQ